MNKIRVKASVNYDIIIEKGLLENAGKYIKDISDCCKIAVITDDIVYKLYYSVLEKSLIKMGYTVFSFVFKNGESQKNLTTYNDILEALSSFDFSRSDLLIALGGGVVGDICGFAASTYQRGIKYIQVPTTLLAATDSSVGGKTAVNLSTGKNQVGSFHQPSLVLCDTDILAYSGISEAIKSGILKSEKLFEIFEKKNPKDHIDEIVSTCVEIKKAYVESDEFDIGQRQFLNLGHTFGHSIEKLSEYKISHPDAVSIGLAIIADYSFKNGFCTKETKDRIINTLKKNNLPISCDYIIKDMINAASVDKKISDNKITLIVIEEIGKCRLLKTDFTELNKLI